MRTMRLVGRFLHIQVMNEFQYRAHLAIQLVQTVIAITAGLSIIELVFLQVSALNGWTKPRILVVLGMFTMVSAVLRIAIRPNLDRFMRDVHRGSLDHVLSKPVDAQVLVSTRAVNIWPVADLVAGVALTVYGLVRAGQSVSLSQVLLFALTFGLGLVTLYSFLMALVISAFWYVRINSFVEFFDGIYQAGRWPIGIYPGWLRFGLTVLVPIGSAITVPATALTTHLPVPVLLGQAALAVIMFTGTRWLWVRGLRRYTGASA